MIVVVHNVDVIVEVYGSCPLLCVAVSWSVSTSGQLHMLS